MADLSQDHVSKVERYVGNTSYAMASFNLRTGAPSSGSLNLGSERGFISSITEMGEDRDDGGD